MEAQPAQVVRHPSLGHLAERYFQQLCQRSTEVAIRETAGKVTEQDQRMQQCLHPGITEPETGRALTLDDGRTLNLLERGFADRAVVLNSQSFR